MTAANRDRLEQVLGRNWPSMGVRELCQRERQLETAAGFTHTLVRYIDDLGVSTAGQALAVLAARSEDTNVSPSNGAVAEPPPRRYDDAVMRALSAELGLDALT